jgi:hypothetical protein
MQDEHMEEIWQAFGDGVRSIIPLLDTEIQGPVMLRKLADHLFV